MCRNQVFLIFANNSRSKQIKKDPAHPFVHIGKEETCVKFQQKILNCMVVGACQSFSIFRQNIWFLENNRVLSKFKYYQIIIKSVNKKQFYFNHASRPTYVQILCVFFIMTLSFEFNCIKIPTRSLVLYLY